LPRQTVAGFGATLDKVIALSPDRLALYSYAHLPGAFKPQRRIAEAELPDGEDKLAILTLAIERLREAGYVYVGMDHFAKPDDPLAIARSGGGCSATSRATPRSPTATCCPSASRRSAAWARPTTRT
jgi:oxygen-independent coproporphyrinogen-3 oxidase